MKNSLKKIIAGVLFICLLFSLISVNVFAKDITTTPTGYDEASDVNYQQSGSYIANWGARGEVATFLSSYAANFYTGSYVYDVMSLLSGGTAQNNAQNSDLYRNLKSLMSQKHSHITSYGETRSLYRYTDCVSNNTSKISSLYSGIVLNGSWDGGSTWNREHTWPNSKGLGGDDENDIMMLRPTAKSENSSRGNTAYGEGSGYYDPGESVRGDCARIVLYVYVRWGNTGRMWGNSGVMESLDVLLRWMEEDPVDTWEMGRNDAVQSITGTRNVFVDYPEYAFLLFGRDVPENMPTPSGSNNNRCKHENTSLRGEIAADCNTSGYTGDLVCSDCNKVIKLGTVITVSHVVGEWEITRPATCTENGEKRSICSLCNEEFFEVIVAGGHSLVLEYTKPATCTESGEKRSACTACDEVVIEVISASGHNLVHYEGKEPTKTEAGYEAYDECTLCDYTTYKEIPSLSRLPEFIEAVYKIDVTKDVKALYEDIAYAKAIYAELTDVDKAEGKEAVDRLAFAINAYNTKAELYNEGHDVALKVAFVHIAPFFAVLSALWQLLFGKTN